MHVQTANLAAYMNVRAKPIQPVHSVEALIANGWPAAVYNAKVGQTIRRNPGLAIVPVNVGTEFLKKISIGEARAAIMPRGDWDLEKARSMAQLEAEGSPDPCDFVIVSSSLETSIDGMLTNMKSSCVQAAISYGIGLMKFDRTLHSLHQNWLRERPCPTLHTPEEGSKELTLTDMAGIFIVWTSGIAAALLIHFIVIHTRRHFQNSLHQGVTCDTNKCDTNVRCDTNAAPKAGRSTEDQFAAIEAMLVEMKHTMVRKEVRYDSTGIITLAS